MTAPERDDVLLLTISRLLVRSLPQLRIDHFVELIERVTAIG